MEQPSGASQVAPVQESPQGVAGHAEMLGRAAPAMQRGMGVHVATDRSLEVRSGLCGLVQYPCSWLRDGQSTGSSRQRLNISF